MDDMTLVPKRLEVELLVRFLTEPDRDDLFTQRELLYLSAALETFRVALAATELNRDLGEVVG